MARKAFKLVFYAAAVGGGSLTTMYLATSEKKWLSRIAFAEEKLPRDDILSHRRQFGESPNFNSPSTSKWIHDWDSRPSLEESKENQSTRFTDSTENKSAENKVKKQKPVATRNIILVRHGQFNLRGESDSDRYLTSLGRHQADATGHRLKELGLSYTRIVHSTMTRADETAKIIHSHLKEVPIESTDLLREGAPFPPEPPIRSWNPPKQDFYEDGPRIERAFRKYFYRANPSQIEDSYDIIVCHANVIRYLLCRSLQIPPEAWLRFTLHNCSLTWVKIRPSGRVGAYIVGDCGHMPPNLLTTS